MFTEIMEVTRNERDKHNEWKDVVSKYRKDASERSERVRQEDQRCRQEERCWRDEMLDLLRAQTVILQRMVDLQEEQRGTRVPLQPLYNHPQSPTRPISPSPRSVRTRGGRLSAPAYSSTTLDSSSKRL